MKAEDWLGRWKGQTVVCIASGPSLTVDDCERVRESGHPTFVTNTTFRLCPWATLLMAHDAAWWKVYRAEVDEFFTGTKVCNTPAGRSYGALTLYPWGRAFANSGTAAIGLAAHGGAARILMLGFDCQRTGGRSHWHGDHPEALSNARSIGTWPKQFKQIARFAADKGSKVVNCSRETALECFERMDLAAAL